LAVALPAAGGEVGVYLATGEKRHDNKDISACSEAGSELI
jgi:hypothetical protein